jgi:hypothetical protein
MNYTMQTRPLPVVAGFLSGLLLMGCDQPLCQNSPPQYQFAFLAAQGQPLVTDSLQAKLLRLAYTSTSGSKVVVPLTQFRPIPTNTQYRYVYQLGYELLESDALSRQYAVELNEQPVGTLRLMAQRNTNKCDGWMHLTEVQANQKPVSIGADNVTYPITINQ